MLSAVNCKRLFGGVAMVTESPEQQESVSAIDVVEGNHAADPHESKIHSEA
jgi:hypothetical protein